MSGATVQSLTTTSRTRGRRSTAALVALAMLASLLALAAGGATTPAAAADVVTNSSFDTDCLGTAGPFSVPQSNSQAFATTAPDSVGPDEAFTVRIAPVESAFPDTNPSPIGEVTVNRLLNIEYMYALPVNADLRSVALVPDSGFGFTGTPTVTVDESFSPPRIVLFVEEVPKNSNEDDETPFQLPAIDLELVATGAVGTNVSTRVPGTDEATAGYVFQADSAAVANVRCWPAAPPAPLLFQTAIAPGSATVETTTTLTANPTILPAGNEVTLTATVDAPSGVVRFADGSTTLGFAALDDVGAATLTVPLTAQGARSLTATFVGSPGFQASTSDPVAVTVTDPSARERARVALSTSVPQTNPGSGTEASVTLRVEVLPEAAAGPQPTGAVRVHVGDELVTTATLVDEGGVASVDVPLTLPRADGGVLLRADYVGDVEYSGAAGAIPYYVGPESSSTGKTVHSFGAVGTVVLNDGEGPLAADSQMHTDLTTEPDGRRSFDGALVLDRARNLSTPRAETTLAVPGGTATGWLAPIGNATGEIGPGADADATLDASFVFQVNSLDLGAGPMDLGSSCWIGPFDLELMGTQTGVTGPTTLSGAGFDLPAVSPSQCRSVDGTALAGAINGRLVGDSTSLAVELATPPVAAQTVVTGPVEVDPPTSTFGQPVTITASVARVDGVALGRSQGNIEFWAGDTLLGVPGFVDVEEQPDGSISASFSLPTQPRNTITGGAPVPPLPVGVNELTARFTPRGSSSRTLAVSEFSEPTEHVVSPALDKGQVTVDLDVPESAPAGQPVTARITLDPLPNEADGLTDLRGSLRIYDLLEPDPGLQEVPNTERGYQRQGGIDVDPDDGVIEVQIYMKPGEHLLQASFLPDLDVAWGWTPALSETVPHTVTGEARPTSVSIYNESTLGTGQVPLGANLLLEVQVGPFPEVAEPFHPNGSAKGGVYYQVDDGPISSASVGTDDGRASLSIDDAIASASPGSHTIRYWYDPFHLNFTFPYPLNVGNQGFSVSPTAEFTYEVVTPGDPAAMPTNTVIDSIYPTGGSTPAVSMTSPPPAEEGTAWARINGRVTFNAPGSVEYVARNVDTSAETVLGSANTSASTSFFSGYGLASLQNAAPTATLPVGTYEVRGTFTPSNPSFLGSTSEPMVIHVVGEGDSIGSTTALAVEPAGVSGDGEPVGLTATVGPAGIGEGTVVFRDGDDELGSSTTVNGVARLLVFDLEPGEHSLTAELVPDSALVEGSTSDPVSHRVNSAPIAEDDSFTTDQGVAGSGAGLLDNDTDADGDPLTAAVADQPANGTVAVDPDGSFTYTPNADFFGTDTFTYTASDDRGGVSTPATVTVTVRGTTTMEASPVLLEVRPLILGLKLYVGTFEGRLTDATGAPIAGETVRFTLTGSQRCTAVTDGDGLAACTVPLLDGVVALLAPQTAHFDGSDVWTPSSATAQLLAIR